MATDGGTIELTFRARLEQFDKDMAAAKSKAAKAGDEMGDEIERRLGSKLQGAGKTLSKTLTPAAAGLGGAFGLAFKEFDSGADTLIAKTGASGKALDELQASMKNVAGGVTSGFGDIGSVMGDLSVALGITGKPLEDLTAKMVKLHEMGQSFDPTSFTRFMGDWSISTEDAGAALDRLYKVAQVTGVGVGELMDKAVQFGAPLRTLGFNTNEATAMIAKFQKEGVNTEAVLAGMKVGLGNMAKAGEAPAATFWRLTGEIKNAATEGEALGIAAQAFGTRAGPDLAAAIREGRFEFEDLASGLGDTTGAIEKAYKGTLDWSDKLEMLKNKVIGVLGPVGEYGMAISGIAAGAGPLLQMGGAIVGHFTASGVAAGAATAPTAGFGAVLWATVAPILAVIAALALIGLAVYLVIRNWDTIKRVTTETWDALPGPVQTAVRIIAAVVTGGFSEIVIAVVNNWSKIRSATITGVMAVVDTFLGMAEKVTGLAARAFGWVPGIGPKMREAADRVAEFRDDVNAYLADIRDKDIYIRIHETTFISTVYGEEARSSPYGRQTAYAAGGFINRPTMALMGEAGRELVLPLTDKDRTRELLGQAGLLGGGSDIAGWGHHGDGGDEGGASVPTGRGPIGPFNFYGVRQDDLPTEIPRRLRGALSLWDR